MFDVEQITELVGKVETLTTSIRLNIVPAAQKVLEAARQVHNSWSGSALGHHALLYYGSFQAPSPGSNFNSEWGTVQGMPTGWSTRSAEEVTKEITRLSGVSLDTWQHEWDTALEQFGALRDFLLTEFSAVDADDRAEFEALLSIIRRLPFDESLRRETAVSTLNAHRSTMSRDARALCAGGVTVPSHVFYDAVANEVFVTIKNAATLSDTAKRLLRGLELAEKARTNPPVGPGEVMRMHDMTNNPFSLRKKDGRTIAFKGLLTKGTVLVTFDSTLPVDDNDIVERTLPGDRLERYIVLDTGFYSGVDGIEDHYQMKVRKENAVAVQASGHPVTNIYNVQGPNARVNLHTVDSSHNVANIGETELFQKMRAAIEAGVSDSSQKNLLLTSVSDLENTSGTPQFAEKFQQLLAGASNCMTILTPFLPALGQLAASAFS